MCGSDTGGPRPTDVSKTYIYLTGVNNFLPLRAGRHSYVVKIRYHLPPNAHWPRPWLSVHQQQKLNSTEAIKSTKIITRENWNKKPRNLISTVLLLLLLLLLGILKIFEDFHSTDRFLLSRFLLSRVSDFLCFTYISNSSLGSQSSTIFYRFRWKEIHRLLLS